MGRFSHSALWGKWVAGLGLSIEAGLADYFVAAFVFVVRGDPEAAVTAPEDRLEAQPGDRGHLPRRAQGRVGQLERDAGPAGQTRVEAGPEASEPLCCELGFRSITEQSWVTPGAAD